MISVSEFEPARVEAKPNRLAVHLRGVLVISAVCALHLVVATALLRMTPESARGVSDDRRAAILSFIVVDEPAPESIEAAIVIPDPTPTVAVELPTPPVFDLSEEISKAPSPSPQIEVFVPPRPVDGMEGALPSFERRAAIPSGKMARIILRVEVLADGCTGAVEIEVESGIRSADEAAIEYARTLRWVPASLGGRPQVTKVRLPVVFTGAS